MANSKNLAQLGLPLHACTCTRKCKRLASTEAQNLCRQDADILGIFYIDHNFGQDGRDDKKTLLLLHGFPSSSYDFAGAFWQGLTTHYSRIIALDLLGYGFSDKPRSRSEKYSIMTEADITEGLLQYLAVEQAHILAHDIGDTVAQELLARFNDRAMGASTGLSPSSPLNILSLCFLNGGLFPEQHRASTTQKILNNNVIGPIVSSVSTYSMFARSFSSTFGPNTQPSRAFLQDTYTSLQLNGGKLILPQLLKYMAERRANRSRWVGAIVHSKCKVGLINGPADPISGKHAAERYKELVSKPWVYMLDYHIGHYPHVEAPQAVLEGYQQFLDHIKN